MIELLARRSSGATEGGRAAPDHRTLIARQRLREVEHAGHAEPYRGGRWIVGVCAPFGVASSRTPSAEDSVLRRSRFGRGAFAHTLRRVRTGERSVALQLAHDEFATLGTTDDDGGRFLFLHETPAGLVLVVDATTTHGELVARFLRSCPHVRQLSVGWVGQSQADRGLADGTICRDVFTALLIEVSIVPAGAFAGTWIG